MNRMIEEEDMTLAFDNEALYNLCSRKIKIESPSYADINKLVAKAVSEMTRSMRFGGCLNTDIKDLKTNLVPYPRVKFVVPSYSPFIEADNCGK
jgi:tubulin alpha